MILRQSLLVCETAVDEPRANSILQLYPIPDPVICLRKLLFKFHRRSNGQKVTDLKRSVIINRSDPCSCDGWMAVFVTESGTLAFNDEVAPQRHPKQEVFLAMPREIDNRPIGELPVGRRHTTSGGPLFSHAHCVPVPERWVQSIRTAIGFFLLHEPLNSTV